MKKIYDCHTGKLIKESDTSKKNMNHLYESVSFEDDILQNGKPVYRSTGTSATYNRGVLYLKKVALSPADKPITIWEYSGNYCAKEIANICEAANLSYCFISARTLSREGAGINDVYNDEDIVIIDDFTYGNTGDVENVIFDAIELSKTKQVICVGRIANNRNNDIFADDLYNEFYNYVYTSLEDNGDDNSDDVYESVTEKFAKYRKLYEEDEVSEGDDDSDSDDDNSSDDNSSDDSNSDDDNSSDDNSDDNSDDSDSNDDSSDDETEDVPMTAILLTVGKDDADACKDELVDAGIPEDGIEILDGEEGDENKKIRVDADYAFELKDYLKGKGIDLEEKIGGEIVDDSASDEDSDNKDDSDSSDSSDDSNDDSELSFDDEFGDLFGDDDSSDEQK